MMAWAPYELAFALLSAPAVGSFLSVLITRLPRHEDVVFRSSHCPHCSRALAMRDLLPVVSFALGRGACRYCRAPISILYPVVEVLALGVAIWAMTATSGWLLLLTCVLGWTLLALAMMDLRELVLSDALTLPLIAGGLATAYAIAPWSIWSHLLGAMAGYLLILAIRHVYSFARGRDGLGLGDAKLLAAAGAWLSWQALGGVVLIAALVTLGGAIAVGWLRKNLAATTALPFGPGLALGFWLSWLYGPLVVS